MVRLDLIEQIYQDMYMQRIKQADPSEWQHRILANRTIEHIDHDANGLTIHLTSSINRSDDSNSTDEVLRVDALIVATGYTRNVYEELLANVQHLRPRGSAGAWEVNRNYSVSLDRSRVSRQAGLWLQGCNEGTHGLSDSLLSVLASRGGELVESIWGEHFTKNAKRAVL